MFSFADAAGWGMRKALAFLLLVALLLGVMVLISYAPDWWQGWKEAGARAKEVAAAKAALLDLEKQLREEEAALANLKRSWPSTWKPVRWFQHKGNVEWQKNKVAAIVRAIEEKRRAIATISGSGGLLDRIHAASANHGWWLASLAAVGLCGPYAWRGLLFYLFCPITRRARPICLLSPESGGRSVLGIVERSLTLEVPPGETLFLRSGYLQMRSRARTGWQLIRFPRAPLVSSAARLLGLTWVRAENSSEPARVVLTTGDPDTYLSILTLREHAGYVLHPRNVAGVSSGIQVRAVWRFAHLHAWLTGQFRYLLFCGSGLILLQGAGGIREEHGAFSSKIEESAVIGFDGRMSYATARTEDAWSYLTGRARLVDDLFLNPLPYLRQVSKAPPAKNILHRTLDALVGSVGKLFGL